MRTLVIAMAVLLSAGSAQGTPATPKQHPPQKPIFVPDYPGMLAMRTNYAPRGATVTPSQISACANVAAMRALGARASGADSVNQGRVADLAFVLCLVNAPVEN